MTDHLAHWNSVSGVLLRKKYEGGTFTENLAKVQAAYLLYIYIQDSWNSWSFLIRQEHDSRISWKWIAYIVQQISNTSNRFVETTMLT